MKMVNLIVDGKSRELAIPDKAAQILRDQTIGPDHPGTILKDFDSLLAFIGLDGLKASGKHYFLPQKELDQLNARMSRPLVHRLRRPQQRSFPHLHGLYMILRASGLGVGVGTSPAGRLTVDQQMLAAWRELNATEQYFTLLESWLVHGSPEILAERGSWWSGCFDSLMWLARKLDVIQTGIPDERHRGGVLHGTMDLVTVALMELFGWLRLEYAEARDGEGMKIAAIERLPLAVAMEAALNSFFLSHKWLTIDEERPAEPGALRPLFQPFFPEWQRTLSVPDTPFRKGTYTWRVCLGQVWREIAAPAEVTLDELAQTILDAFRFDTDHLYCFQLRDRRGRNLRIACPYEEDAEAFTDEVRLGDLPLPEGGTMTFVFDYGDNWQFTVTLEAVAARASKRTRPKITARHGRAPSQYSWDEDEYD